MGKDRDDFVIATKFGVGQTRNESYAQKGSSRKAMMTAVESSLRRLHTDYTDLYWQHAFEDLTPLEETLRGFDDLIRAGKIRYAGLSNFPAWRVAWGTARAVPQATRPSWPSPSNTAWPSARPSVS